MCDSVLSVAAINKWLELERKALLQKPEENQLPDNSAKAVQKAIDWAYVPFSFWVRTYLLIAMSEYIVHHLESD